MGEGARSRSRRAVRIAGATTARFAALEVFRRVRTGDLADRALDAATRGLAERDRDWTRELVYGGLRLRGRLDYLLGRHVRSGLTALDPDVLDVLRLGAYQMLEMDSVPPYAAISQSVELARDAGAGRASGLVNGVLQSLRRAGPDYTFPDPRGESLHYLEAWGSHPRWLLERWIACWGLEDTRRLVEANNQRPELYIHPLGVSQEQAVNRLQASGLEIEAVPVAPGALRILPPGSAREALETVPAVVQDPAAQLVVHYAAMPEGGLALDLCAAPGGKALALANRARYVAASDVSPRRLPRVRENVQRLGREDRVGITAADGRAAPFREADLVLLDVPCTGTGTLRRHPDARWRISEADLGTLATLQRDLIESAARHVRVGGWLVYSTCSLEPEENELQIQRFLAEHPDWEPDPVPGAVPPSVQTANGWLEVLPQRTGTDGSFAARLRRRQ